MERILRDKDQKCYQPRIHSDRIKELYRIGQETGLPMTVIINFSISKFIEAYEKKKQEKEDLINEVAWRQENEYDEKLDQPEEDLSTYLDQYGEDY